MRFLTRGAFVSIAMCTAVAVTTLHAQSAADGDLEQLLARATWYSIDFVNKLS